MFQFDPRSSHFNPIYTCPYFWVPCGPGCVSEIGATRTQIRTHTQIAPESRSPGDKAPGPDAARTTSVRWPRGVLRHCEFSIHSREIPCCFHRMGYYGSFCFARTFFIKHLDGIQKWKCIRKVFLAFFARFRLRRFSKHLKCNSNSLSNIIL